MKKHKMIALLLALIITFGSATATFATSENNIQNLSQEYINKEEIKDDELPRIEKVGNKIYVDGVHEATVYELSPIINTLDNTTADADMLRGGWHYTDNCPYGSRSDYTKYITTRNKNIQFERSLASQTLAVLGGIIARGLNVPMGIALNLASNILSQIPGSQYGNLKTLYFKETIYAHKTLPGIYRMNNLSFYFDPNYSDYATSVIKYSWWG